MKATTFFAATSVLWAFLFVAPLFAAKLLNWEEGENHRRAQLTVETGEADGFEEMSAAVTGIDFLNRFRDEVSITNQIYLNGSGVAAADVDGDDLCDLYFCGLEGANTLYRNLGGWRFENITAFSKTACANQASTGAVFADIDGDGDLDFVLTQIDGPPRLFRNELPTTGNWVRIRLRGVRQNREGIGAWIRLEVDGRALWRQVMPFRGYLSQSELPVTIGLGTASAVESLKIIWPGGRTQAVEDVPLGRTIEIWEK